MITATRITAIVKEYADGPRLLEETVAGIPDDELRFRPGPGHWSIHENVVHVADTDLVTAVRLRYILTDPGSTLLVYDHTRWGSVLEYASLSLGTALSLLRQVRAATTEILQRLPAERWELSGKHTQAGPQTVEWIVEHYAHHVHYHLRTIAKRRRQYAESKR